jgi:hypothetical protein
MGVNLTRKLTSDSSIEEEDGTFHEDCIWLGAKKDVDFSSYVSVDIELATCSFSSIDVV